MKIDLVLLIVTREDGMEYAELLENLNPGGVASFPCRGTARDEILQALGIEKTEKLLLATAVEHSKVRKILNACMMQLGLAVPGQGIALTIPMESIGGKSSLKQLTGLEKAEKDDGSEQDVEYKNTASMILAIVENEHSDEVMDVARGAGAGGGTVIHAKGTAGSMAKKFFGVTLGQEKEIILIVSKHEDKNAIMQAIMDKAGVNSPAHTVLFSLPVDQVAGIRSFEVESTPEQ